MLRTASGVELQGRLAPFGSDVPQGPGSGSPPWLRGVRSGVAVSGSLGAWLVPRLRPLRPVPRGGGRSLPRGGRSEYRGQRGPARAAPAADPAPSAAAHRQTSACQPHLRRRLQQPAPAAAARAGVRDDEQVGSWSLWPPWPRSTPAVPRRHPRGRPGPCQGQEGRWGRHRPPNQSGPAPHGGRRRAGRAQRLLGQPR